MPDLSDRLRNWFRLLGKYSLSSLTATGFDFLTFSIGLSWLLLSAVESTVLGRCVGSIVAFWLQRKWVFQRPRTRQRWPLVLDEDDDWRDKPTAQTTQWWPLTIKYFSGVLLGMGLNVGGVWLLNNLWAWNPWPARITSALGAWILIFLFNKYLVFNPSPNRRPFHSRT